MKKYTSVIIVSLFFMSCFGQGIWNNHAPNIGGRLSAIVASPNSANTLLVASPGGGIWRTTNGGSNWYKPLNYALGDYCVLDLQWDRIRSGRLFASTNTDLYASTDMGDNWSCLTHLGGTPAPLMINKHFADPKPFAQLRYSANESTVFWCKPSQGIFYSYDGITFTQHVPFPGGSGNLDNTILTIAADDATGYVYFSTISSYDPNSPPHIFRSSSPWTASRPCLTWDPINVGLPNNSQICAIVYGGIANRLALALSINSITGTRVYITSDGRRWAATATQPPPNHSYGPRPLVSPAPNQLLLGAFEPFVSNDWGNTWINFTIHDIHSDTRAFYWGSYQDGNFLWATTDGAHELGTMGNIVRWNFNPGSSPSIGEFSPINGLKVWQCYFMAATGIRNGPRKRIFLGSQDNGLLVSDDEGVSWTTDGLPYLGTGDRPSLVFAPSNPDRGYGRSNDEEFVRYDSAYTPTLSRDIKWTILPGAGGGLPVIWTNAMTSVDPRNPDRVCFAFSTKVAISINAGRNWNKYSLPGNASPICVHLDTDGSVYAGTLNHGIFKSTNNGQHWDSFGLNLQGITGILKIVHSTAGGSGGTFFAATSQGLYRKLPGDTFRYIEAAGAPAYIVSDVEFDPDCPSRIYISNGYMGDYGQHRGGILMSDDNGTTFTSITGGQDIHQAPISDIQVDPVSSRFVHTAVYGLGGWTYDLGAIPPCR